MPAPHDEGGPALPAAPGEVDLDGLRAWGHALGRVLRGPVIVAIRGDLGAGKTTLVQAIAEGAGVGDEVTSPTFALVHEYGGAHGIVHHLDLYRLDGPGQLTNLAWDEIVGGDGIVLIEWPERAGNRLPAPRLDVTLRAGSREDLREVEATWTA